MGNKLDTLDQATSKELKHRWKEAFGKAPSRYASKDFLKLNLAYHWQEKRQGGLSKKVQGTLCQLYHTFKQNPDYRPIASRPALKSGTRLVRQWQGQTHTVTVKSDYYEYQDKEFKSLSAIAQLMHIIRHTAVGGDEAIAVLEHVAGDGRGRDFREVIFNQMRGRRDRYLVDVVDPDDHSIARA